MKNTFILLAVFCFLSVAVVGQNKGQRVGLLREAANKHIVNKSLKNLGSSSNSSGDFKSLSEIRQKLEFVVYEGPDSTGVLITWFKDEYRYDTSGRLTEDIWWEYEDNTYIPSFKDVTDYDSNGNISLLSSLMWDSLSSTWVSLWKEERLYDSGNDVILTQEYYFDDSTNVWLTTWKMEYTYDAEKNLISKVNSGWDEFKGIWSNGSKNDYEYDHGNLVKNTSSYWDDSTAAWMFTYKTVSIYNASGNETMQTGYQWNQETSQWLTVHKEEMTYNSNGKISGDVSSDWDFEKEVWVPFWEDSYNWDESGNLAQIMEYFDRDSSGQWREQYKTILAYNNSFRFENLLLPANFFSPDFFNHMLLTLTGSLLDDSTNQWVVDQNITLQYSEINIGGIPELSISEIKVFPNPASDIIRIESDIPMVSAKFELNDIQGRRVLSENLNGARKIISVKSLPGGVYFYQIVNKGEIRRGKIIVR